MVTLIGKPVSNTSRSTSRTFPISCCPFKEPNESILTPCHHDTPTFLTPAGLRGIPTNVPTTAAAPADDDDDRMRCHPSAILDDDNHTLTPFDHLATPTQTVSCHEDTKYDYKTRMQEIDDAINQMIQSWPKLRPYRQNAPCQQTTTTPSKAPENHCFDSAALASSPTAAHPATTPTVQQGEAIITEYPCPNMMFLGTKTHPNTTPMTADEKTAADNGNKVAPQSVSTLVIDSVYCAPTNPSASLTASKKVHGSYPLTPPPTPHVKTTLDNPAPTTTTILPTPELVYAKGDDRHDRPPRFDRHERPPRTTPHESDGPVRLATSIDRLADQQTRYFAMMNQANAHITAQLQKIVLLMHPLVANLPPKVDAPTPPQTPESLPKIVRITTTPDLKSDLSAHDNFSNYPTTIDTMPTIAMHTVKFPPSPGVPITPVPPWPPPPVRRMPCHTNQGSPWQYAQTIKLLSIPGACTHQLMQHIPVSTWTSPVIHPNSCPSSSLTKHSNYSKAPFRFKHPFFTGRSTLTKDFMRPP